MLPLRAGFFEVLVHMGVLMKTFVSIYKDGVSRYLYNTGTPDATQIVEAKRITNDGYREFLSAHDWTFLTPETTITLWTTKTGTMTVSGAGNTTVTAAAAAFYASMVGQVLKADVSGNKYTITAYTSATVVTVSADASADTGKAFTVTATGTYGLPADFGALVDRFSFPEDAVYQPLQPTTPENIRSMRTSEASPSDDPRWYALQPRAYTATDGQRWDLLVWPTPNTTRAMGYRYRLDPTEMATDAEYPVGGPTHSMTIEHAAKMMAERAKGLVDGHFGKLYREYFLPLSIQRDREMRPRNLGYIGDDSDGVADSPFSMSEWSYG